MKIIEYKGVFINLKKSKMQKNREFYEEYKNLMSEILTHEKLKRLDNYTQHFKCTRLKHSIDVSYYSFYIAKLFNLDYISAARAGLLHDLYFQKETHIKKRFKMLHTHPKDALANAIEICGDLNAIERDAILKHMWLVTAAPPKYRESYIVSFVDKYCAVKEFFSSVFSKDFAKKSYSRMIRFY